MTCPRNGWRWSNEPREAGQGERSGASEGGGMTDAQFLMWCGEVWLAVGFLCKEPKGWLCTLCGSVHIIAALCK